MKAVPRGINATAIANIRRLFDWELGFFTSWRPVYERQLSMAGAMRRAGVKFLAGTDTFNAYCFPGFSVHDELELLVRAGLTPMQVIVSATKSGAKLSLGPAGIGVEDISQVAP